MSVLAARWRPAWLCFVYFTLLRLNTHGQEALTSVISLDESIAAKAAQPPVPHLGPVQYGLGTYAGVTYDDNVNGSQSNPQSDLILRAGLNLNFDWQATDHSELQFGTSIGYLDYQKYTGNNGLEISPDSALTYAISIDEVILTLFDQVSYSRQVRTEAALANIIALPQFNNNAGVQAEWDPGRWMLSLSYSHDDFLSDHAHDYLNRASEYFTARAGWKFAEATQAGLEASDALTAYQVSGQFNNQNLSLGGYLEWQVLPSLHITARGGPAFYEPDSSGPTGGGPALNTYYVDLEISHQLTDFLSHNVSINRSLQAGLNQGGSYIEQLTISYTISWRLTQRITIGASASYVDGQQPLGQSISPFSPFPVNVSENYDQYDGGLQASWQFTDHLGATVNFNHYQRNSNLAGRGNSDNSVALQFNYSF
jgi:hypothetical protein